MEPHNIAFGNLFLDAFRKPNSESQNITLRKPNLESHGVTSGNLFPDASRKPNSEPHNITSKKLFSDAYEKPTRPEYKL